MIYLNQTIVNSFDVGLSGYECSLIIGLIIIIIVTIGGNLLVLYAIMIKPRLRRSITNCLIASLAAADLLLGAIVMPFAVVDYYRSMYKERLPLNQQKHYILWLFGKVWCDMWHAFDVLSSTASILNLCVISVERYIAISDPINYPLRMTHKRCFFMILIIWVCSSFISFPAIIWWRYSESLDLKHQLKNNSNLIDFSPNNICVFSTDSIYLFISSLISFYIPLIVMLIVYWKIYQEAKRLLTSFNTGRRVINRKSLGGEVMILRVHRGGMINSKCKKSVNQKSNQFIRSNCMNANDIQNKIQTENNRKLESNKFDSLRKDKEQTNVNKQYTMSLGCYKIVFNKPEIQETISIRSDLNNVDTNENLSKNCLNEFKKRIQKFTNEKRAAKTLGLVMGVFVLCWSPFFIYNTIKAIYPIVLSSKEQIIFFIVTWLGYINSSINPLIYAYSMKDMRRAFAEILCGVCVKKRRGRGYKSVSSNNFNAQIINKKSTKYPIFFHTETITSSNSKLTKNFTDESISNSNKKTNLTLYNITNYQFDH